jgi:ABC-2 type transport system ATP-binding protein
METQVLDTLKVNNISKSYGDVHAVQDLSFSISQGQIFGLLGPNGAGKTTTIRMIMEIILPDKGSIEIFGKPNCRESRDQIGYLPEERGLFRKMKIKDVLSFFGELKEMNRHQTHKKATEYLERFQLSEWADKKVEELSRGMQQKLQFITTILHEPKLIILDEPFTGLDPVNTNMVKNMMLEMKEKGTTIIFSTHLMEQVEKLCESICLIDSGKSILGGPLSDIKKTFGKNRVRMAYEGNAEFLRDEALVKEYNDFGNYVEILLAENRATKELLAVANIQVAIKSFKEAEPSLNEIFIKVVGK